MAFCEQKAFSLSSRDPLAAPDFNSPFRCHFPRFYCDALHDLPNVKEHAPLSAGAHVDHGVDVGITVEHVNRAADRGCCVSVVGHSFSGVYAARRVSRSLKLGRSSKMQ